MDVLERLESKGWCDIAPPTPEELSEEPSLLGFVIAEDGSEYPIRGGVCTSQETPEEHKCDGLVSYSEYSTGEYTVLHREVERTVEIEEYEVTKPLPQVMVIADE